MTSIKSVVKVSVEAARQAKRLQKARRRQKHVKIKFIPDIKGVMTPRHEGLGFRFSITKPLAPRQEVGGYALYNPVLRKIKVYSMGTRKFSPKYKEAMAPDRSPEIPISKSNYVLYHTEVGGKALSRSDVKKVLEAVAIKIS